MGYDITKSRFFTTKTPSIDTVTSKTIADYYADLYGTFTSHSNSVSVGLKEGAANILCESGMDLLKNISDAMRLIGDATDKCLSANLKVINATLDSLKYDSKRIQEINEYEQVYFTTDGYEYTISSDIPDFGYAIRYVDEVREDVLGCKSFSIEKAEDLKSKICDGEYLDKFKAKLIKEKYPLKTDTYADAVAPKFRNGESNPITLVIDTDYINKMLKFIPELQATLKESIKQKEHIKTIITKYRKLCEGGESSWYQKHVNLSKTSGNGKEILYALNTYCNARSREATSILNAVTLVYIEKFMAIKEAVQLYSYIFKMILSQYGGMPVSESWVDYSDKAFTKYNELEESYYDLLLEADENSSDGTTTGTKKVGWFKKLIEVVKKLFEKFFLKNEKLIEENDKWLKADGNLKRLQTMSFKGLKVKVQAINGDIMKNTVSVKNITANMLSKIPSDAQMEDIKSRGDLETYGDYKKIKINDLSFSESVKIKYHGGKDKMPEPIILEDEALKSYCIGTVVPFVTNYKNMINGLKSDISAFETRIKNIENELKRRGVAVESYTDMYDILFEADSDDNKSDAKDNKPEPTKDEDLKLNKVVSSERESKSTSELKYVRWAAQLHQIALTTQLTVYESYYISGMSLLRGVLREKE